MKIGIVSDTHGMYESWQSAYKKYLHDCAYIFHAGDVLYHGPRNPVAAEYNPAAMVLSLNTLPNVIIFAQGNCDAEVDNMVIEHPLQNPYALADIQGKRIVLTHGHYFDDASELQKVAKRFKANLLIYGHIHLPVLEQIDGITYLNPGSISLPKTDDQRGTLALWENGVLNIIYCDNGEICKQVEF